MTTHALCSRMALPVALTICLVSGSAAQGQKRPLTHADYDGWRSIYTPTLTRDGRFLIYSFMPQDGDGDLIIRDVKTGHERRESVGALPPPVIQNPDEANPDEPPPVRSVRIVTSSDSRFVAATTFADKKSSDIARRERKRPEEMPKGELLVVDLTSGAATRLPAVKSIQMPARGGAWLAYLKEAPPAGRDATAKSGADEEPRARDASRVEYGTDLVLRDLAQQTERTFPDVLEYSFARDGKTLVYAVSSRTVADNGVYAVTPGTSADPTVLLKSGGR